MSNKYTGIPVVVGMATTESRASALLDSVMSIADQVDEVHIYANDYAPEVSHPRVKVHHAPLGDIGDAGFMYPFSREYRSTLETDDVGESINMIIGDDVIYPANYVESMIGRLGGLSSPDSPCAISLHGRLQMPPSIGYYTSLRRSQAVNGMRRLSKDTPVSILGTAYAVWFSSWVDFSIEDDFPQLWDEKITRNMGDIWFSKKLNDLGIPRVAVRHAPMWVGSVPGVDHSTSIAYRGRLDDSVQTSLFNSVDWSILSPKQPEDQ